MMENKVHSFLSTKFPKPLEVNPQIPDMGIDALIFIVKHEEEEICRVIKYTSEIYVKKTTYFIPSKSLVKEIVNWFGKMDYLYERLIEKWVENRLVKDNIYFIYEKHQ